MKMVSNRITYIQSLRRKDAGEVGAWIWTAHFEHVTCFSDEKIFRIDAVAPGRSFHTFYQGKQGRRNNATPFLGHTMRKERWSRCHVGPLLSHFSRHMPPRLGLSMDTPRRHVAWPTLSPDLSPNGHILWSFERDSRRIGLVILSFQHIP